MAHRNSQRSGRAIGTRYSSSVAKRRKGIVPKRTIFMFGGVFLLILLGLYAGAYSYLFDKKVLYKPDIGNQATVSYASVPSSTASVLPSGILNLTNWKLTLPIASSGGSTPEEITQPQLNNFTLSPYFYVNSVNNGVVFEAPVGGVTTSGSEFPRSELREMANNGSALASWSTNVGVNTMTISEAITHLPPVRPEVVAGQIHGPSDYVILIRLNDKKLFVEANGKDVGTLNSDYTLGTIFTVSMTASKGIINVSYNGVQKAVYANKGSGYYFKAGCYTQSNPSKGDSPTSYGQVVIYNLQVSHS